MSAGFSFTRGDFPDDFLFGVATSSYQIEGHAYGGAGSTHWDTFAATPGNVYQFHNGDRACDHYHRWPEDLDLMAGAGFDAYRFSTSWARVMPDGKTLNPEGLDFYDRLVDGMLERGIRPFATLYHWELPSALADIGGWRNREIPERFAEFSRATMARLGDRVQATATINEPWCVAWLSHFIGQHAPGMRDIRAAARAMHHVLLAHGLAVQALRAEGIGQLGIVTNLDHAAPADDSEGAARASATYDAIFNQWFLGAAFKKEYPADALIGLEPYLPDGWAQDFDTIASPVDWVGINYYTRKLLADDGTGMFPALVHVPGDLPTTDKGWEIYPEGFEELLVRIQRDYTGEVPIYITENGMANPDIVVDGAVNDQVRIDYLDQHFHAAKRAMEAGVPLKGYFVWSLLDNYEWSYGYDMRFGMVHVDFDTLVRTPKASFLALKEAIRRA